MDKSLSPGGGGGGGGRGVNQISSDGDDPRIFLGLELLIPGFFWVGKFDKYFWGWLDLKGKYYGFLTFFC